jgi:hypothetical protein
MRLPLVRPVVWVLAFAWVAAPSPARGQLTGTLTDGAATFTFNETPTAENSGTYTADFRPQGATSANDIYSQWLFYEVAGDNRIRPFGNYTRSDGGTVAITGAMSGNTMTYSLTEKTAAATTRFTGTWALQLTHGTSTGKATVSHTVTITNPTASPLTISLFHYLDYDLNGDPSNHTATGGLAGMTITNGLTKATYTPGTAASHYQVATGGTLDAGFLNGTVTSLNDTGLPFGPDDWSGAYQWNLTIPAGQSATVTFAMDVSPAPEPGTVLGLAAAGLAGWAARRRLKARAGRP